MQNKKLSSIDRIKIAGCRLNGESQQDIADKFGVCRETINKIVSTEIYKSIEWRILMSTAKEYGKDIARNMKENA